MLFNRLEGFDADHGAEAEYDVLFTNRLILQPLVEPNLYGNNDPQRDIGAGLSTIEAGWCYERGCLVPAQTQYFY